MFVNGMENLLKYGKTQGLLEGKDMGNIFCRYSVGTYIFIKCPVKNELNELSYLGRWFNMGLGIYNKVIGLTCFKPSAARIENIQTLKKASAVPKIYLAIEWVS